MAAIKGEGRSIAFEDCDYDRWSLVHGNRGDSGKIFGDRNTEILLIHRERITSIIIMIRMTMTMIMIIITTIIVITMIIIIMITIIIIRIILFFPDFVILRQRYFASPHPDVLGGRASQNLTRLTVLCGNWRLSFLGLVGDTHPKFKHWRTVD